MAPPNRQDAVHWADGFRASMESYATGVPVADILAKNLEARRALEEEFERRRRHPLFRLGARVRRVHDRSSAGVHWVRYRAALVADGFAEAGE